MDDANMSGATNREVVTMRTAWQVSLFVGLLSLVFGVIDHFTIILSGGAMLAKIGEPDAFLQFAIALFTLALVLGVADLRPAIVDRTNGGDS